MGEDNPTLECPFGNYSPKNFEDVLSSGDELPWDSFRWAFLFVYDKKEEKIIPFEPVYTNKIESVKHPYADYYRDVRVVRILFDETSKKLEELDEDRYESLIGKTFTFLRPEGISLSDDYHGGNRYWTEIDGKKFLFNDRLMGVEFEGKGFKDIKAYAKKDNGNSLITCTLDFDGNVGVWTILDKRFDSHLRSLNGLLEKIYEADDIYDVAFDDNRRRHSARNKSSLVVIINGKKKSVILCYDEKEHVSELYARTEFFNSKISQVAGLFYYFIVQDSNEYCTIYYLGHDGIVKKKNYTKALPSGRLAVFGEIFATAGCTLLYSFDDKDFYVVYFVKDNMVVYELNTLIDVPCDLMRENVKKEKVLYFDEDSGILSTKLYPCYVKYYGRNLTEWQKKNCVIGYYIVDKYVSLPTEFDAIVGIYKNGKFSLNKEFPVKQYMRIFDTHKTMTSEGNIIEINERTMPDLIKGVIPKSDYVQRN